MPENDASNSNTSYDGYRELGEAAWSWVLDQVREDDGPWLPETVSQDAAKDGPDPVPAKDRDSLYAGIAGLAPVLAEIALHREPSDRRAVAWRPGS